MQVFIHYCGSLQVTITVLTIWNRKRRLKKKKKRAKVKKKRPLKKEFFFFLDEACAISTIQSPSPPSIPLILRTGGGFHLGSSTPNPDVCNSTNLRPFLISLAHELFSFFFSSLSEISLLLQECRYPHPRGIPPFFFLYLFSCKSFDPACLCELISLLLVIIIIFFSLRGAFGPVDLITEVHLILLMYSPSSPPPPYFLIDSTIVIGVQQGAYLLVYDRAHCLA